MMPKQKHLPCIFLLYRPWLKLLYAKNKQLKFLFVWCLNETIFHWFVNQDCGPR